MFGYNTNDAIPVTSLVPPQKKKKTMQARNALFRLNDQLNSSESRVTVFSIQVQAYN